MKGKYIVALDQGTTSSRAILFDASGQIAGISQREFTQHFPRSGWVEHDAEEIWQTQWDVFIDLIKKNDVEPGEIIAIGITNQRETTVVWNKDTGQPIHHAIVWQDKRTSGFCDELKKQGLSEKINRKTGLVIDSYFSGTKIHWLLENVPGARQQAESGKLKFGTIDTWLLWKLTKGKVHATDHTNASRTMLYNIIDNRWDEELLRLLKVPETMLPAAHPSSYHYGDLEYEGHNIPIMGVAGDQQAALFGQACFMPGEGKNTYGTGCFMLMNTGHECRFSRNGLITTLACSTDDQLTYALEGSVFIAGAAVQWLRDGLRIMTHASESEDMAKSTTDDDVYLVPAFTGLGAPYWDQYARGAIFGLTRDTKREHLVKAALESIAYQTRDVMEAMRDDSGVEVTVLKVDGGATANNFLMQFQADILGVEVDRPEITESTALGAALLAGLRAGLWTLEELGKNRKTDQVFSPKMTIEEREARYDRWKNAVKRTLGWLGE